MGQDIQGLRIPGPMSGGLQDEHVRRINNQLIESGRSEEVDRAIREVPRTVVKEPRFASLAKPELVQAWYELRPESRLLVLRRDFRDVGCSLHSSHGIKPIGKSPEEATAMIETGFNVFTSEVARLGIPNEQFEFPAFCNQRDRVLEVLQSFGQLKFRPDRAIIEHFKCMFGMPAEVWNQ